MPPAKKFTRSNTVRRPQMGSRAPSGDKTEQNSSGVGAEKSRAPGQIGDVLTEGIDGLHAEKIVADGLRSIEQTVANGLRVIGRLSADMNKKQYADGVKAGKRLAKGKSEFAKAHGGQKVLDDIMALQFVDFVDGSGVALGAAAHQFRAHVIEAWKELDLIDKIPSADALMRLYKRVKTGKRTIESHNRRGYELLKRGRPDT
jgi:hypothetical protein